MKHKPTNPIVTTAPSTRYKAQADVYRALLRDMPMYLVHYNGEEFICRHCARSAYYAADIEHKTVCVVTKVRRALTADDAEIAAILAELEAGER